MKPFGAAERASDRSTLVVWDSQFVMTPRTRKYCQRFAPSTAEPYRRTSQSVRINAGAFAFAGIDDECNLKAVALKALKSRNRLCEKDSQRTAAGCSGEEYASPSSGAWAQPRSVGPRERHQPHLSQRGRTVRTQCLDRQHCAHCSRAQG